MGSSPGFVSNPCDCGPIQTRFRYASGCISLRLATKINSPAHSPKGTPSGLVVRRQLDALRLLVSVRFQVLFHSPSRGTFHLSLTVLVHYRSSNVFSLGEWTPQIPTGLACPVVLRYLTRASQFSLTGLSPSMVKLSSHIQLTDWFLTLICQTLQPRPCKHGRFGLFRVRSPLLAE